MLLFTGRNSICTQKVLITMFEKNLSWDTRRVDLFKNEQYDPEYLKYNPKGVVPTLVHNDRAIVESTLICAAVGRQSAMKPGGWWVGAGGRATHGLVITVERAERESTIYTKE